MRFKRAILGKAISVVVFSFFIYTLFPQSAKISLIKIYKNKDANHEILYSPQIKTVQKLKNYFIAFINSEFDSRLSSAGFKFDYLDDDIKDKKYYLVNISSPAEIKTLSGYGRVRLLENNLALFWVEKEISRDTLPARFRLIPLSRKPLRDFIQSFSILSQNFGQEIKLSSESAVKNSSPQTFRIELIKIQKNKDADHKALYSPQVKIVKELKTCFIAHASPESLSVLSAAGFFIEQLDDDMEDKKYYLVHCPAASDFAILGAYGNVRIIEENLALFWSDQIEAREILPSPFELALLPDEPLHSYQERTLTSLEVSQPEIELPSKFRVNTVIQEIIDQVSKANLTGYVQSLQDFQTRYASTSQCESAADFIYNFFIQLGLDAEYDSFSFPPGYSSKNIIATLEGQVDPTQVVIICAHYDSYSRQPYALAPGADDNASGCAAVMEASRILAAYPLDFTVKFICFSAEEWGLYGSRDYAQDAMQRGEDIIAVLNLDMIAYTDILPEDLDIVSNSESKWLADRFSSVSNMYTLLNIAQTVNPSFVWSDHSPFWDNGYSAILGIEDMIIMNPYYHTVNDTIDTLNLDFMIDAVKTCLATAADLAQPLSSPRSPTGLSAHSQVISSLFSSIKSVYLSWDENPGQVIGYNIYRTETSRQNYQKINSTPLTQTYYVDRNLDPNIRYFYMITAVGGQNNESNFSKEVRDDEGNSYIN